MREASGGSAPSYDVQVSTDSANGVIILAQAVQDRADVHRFIPAVLRVERSLNHIPNQWVVDGGFTSRENILYADQRKFELFGSLQILMNNP